MIVFNWLLKQQQQQQEKQYLHFSSLPVITNLPGKLKADLWLLCKMYNSVQLIVVK